ncbi:kinase-like domain-containing protein [Mycena galopus ATCC 62051]|nr:kinase-like domain-containing protein [Mycena galopus ATCC 62051]
MTPSDQGSSSSEATNTKFSKVLLVTEREAKWVEIQPFLLSAGYKLRPRYDPNWVPSWWSLTWQECEHNNRWEESRTDVLKWMATTSEELQCIKYISNISDPRNRIIPILQILPLPDGIHVLVVMPYGRQFNHPAFHCRLEFVEVMRQFLEGLELMHEHNFCHFDIAPKNLMMDETRAVPRGSHFSYPKTHDGYRGVFAWENRCSVGPVDYYYIDFGLSRHYPKGKDTALTMGTLRTFPTIPELSETVPYNPFKVDVFQLGLTMANVIKVDFKCYILSRQFFDSHFTQDYPALRAFYPVADRMMSTNPSDRPEPAQSLQEFNSIADRMSSKELCSPILRKEGNVTYFLRKVASVFQKDYLPTKRYERLMGSTDKEILLDRLFCGI